jgi:hypothetical protein
VIEEQSSEVSLRTSQPVQPVDVAEAAIAKIEFEFSVALAA